MDVLAQRIKRTVILIVVLLIPLLNKRCHKCQFLSPKPRSLYQDNITRLTSSLLIIQRTMLLCILHSTTNIRISTRTHRNLMFQMFPGTHQAKSQPNRQKVHPSTPCLQAFKSKKICIANKFTRKSSINHNRFHDNSRQHEALKDLLFRMKIFRSPISNVTLSLEGDILEKSCLLSTGNQEVSLR